MKSSPTPLRSLLALTGLIFVTFCASLAGIFSPPGDWYASLANPSWNPPPWIFGPVWTALYLTIEVAPPNGASSLLKWPRQTEPAPC